MNPEIHKGNDTAKAWTAGFKECLRLYTSAVMSEELTIEAAERSGILLRVKEFGNDLYDGFLLLCSGNTNNVETLLTKIHAIVSNIPIFRFIRVAKRILDMFSLDDGNLNMKLTTYFALIVLSYNRGNLIGVYTKDSQALFIKQPTVLEIYTMAVLHLADRDLKVSGGSKLIVPNKKNEEKIRKHIRNNDPYRVMTELVGSGSDIVLTTLNNCISTFPVHVITNFFYEINPGSELRPDVYYSTFRWEREDTSTRSVMFNLGYQLMVNEICPVDIFKNRNRYIRDKGVHIKLTETVDGLSELVLREYHSKENHYLLISYSTDLGEHRMLPINMKELNKSFFFVLYEMDITVFIFVLLWLGLDKYTNYFPEEIKNNENVIKRLEGELNIDKSCEVFHNTLDEVFRLFSKYAAEDNLTYTDPVAWNYGVYKSNSFRKNKDDVAHILERKFIGRFTRTLPEGHKASEEAKVLAKKYFIDLGDNKTLVDDFVRTQKVRL